jgi:hypothetical protein
METEYDDIIENNGIISNKEIIDIFCKKFNDDPNYCIYGYKFNDMVIDIKIKNKTDDIYYIETYSLPYHYHDMFSHTYDDTYIDNDFETFKSIESAIKFLLCDLRKNYIYSKVFNIITSKDTVKDDEKQMIADCILCNNPRIDKCCVCYDVNSIYTICEHNLCRICYYKIETKKCPVCREIIL